MSPVFYWNGHPFGFEPGETVAVALMRAGIRKFGMAPTGQAYSLFCGIGQCQGCLVIEETAGVAEACLLQCQDGMKLSAFVQSSPVAEVGND